MATDVSTRKNGRAGVAAAWWARSADLVSWAWARLVNRADVWGGYRPLAEAGLEYTRRDGSKAKLGAQTTRPAPSRRGREFLTAHVLARHFAGFGREELVGLHSTSPENFSRWGALDIDWYRDTSTAPVVNLSAALAWFGDLVGRGFRPLLVDSDGAGGFHLWAVFAAPVPTTDVHHFLKAPADDHGRYGMGAVPEIFPKQPAVAPPGRPGQYGNWLRLPGRHHTRDHWSRVWDGRRWLDGAAAVEFILALRGDPPALIPAGTRKAVVREAPHRSSAPRQARPVATSGGLGRRVRAYVAGQPRLAAGQGRHRVGFALACWLARDLGLADQFALGWLRGWDAGNAPPLGAEELAGLLACAHAYGQHAYGSGLGCGGCRRGRRRHRVKTIRFRVEI
jgi:hypothetical protein